MSMMDWSEETIFFDGDAFFDDSLRAIDEAKESVDLETYIYLADPVGRAFEDALSRAARRGVKVRLLVDGVGASGWIERRGLALDAMGVAVRVYHPLLFSALLHRFMSDLGLRKKPSPRSLAPLARMNRRTHRKMCLIDGQTAYVGSLNISASHSKRHNGPLAWRDTGVRVRGEPVCDLEAAFEHAWLRSHAADGRRRWRDSWRHRLSRERALRNRSPLVRLNYTSRLRRRNLHEFLQKLASAQTRVWITNAYLAPSAPVMRALIRAAQRGIDVRLLLPRKSDVFFMPWIATVHYAPLLQGRVRIFEYLPSFLHAKSVIIDDWHVVGTSNMNRRSVLHDLEVDVVLSRRESLLALEHRFHEDLASAEEIIRPGRGWVNLLGRVFSFLLKRWI